MKVISKLLMCALVLSVFAGCSKDKDDEEKKDEEKKNILPIEGVVGTYLGTFTNNPIQSAIDIKYVSDNTVSINIPANSIPDVNESISITCAVTSDKAKYSLSGNATFNIQNDTLSVEITNNSSIDTLGVIDIKMICKGEKTFNITFSGENKKNFLPLEGVAGNYKGALRVSIEENPIENVLIEIRYTSNNTALINIPAGSIPVMPIPINATCTVTSDKEKYSLSGNATITLPEMGDIVVVVVNTSSIKKSGEAILNMTTTIPVITPNGESESGDGSEQSAPTVTMIPITIDFTGKKQ
jgi:hypothetical protein